MELMMNTDFPSVRDLLNSVSPRGTAENRKSWFWKLAARSGVSFRMIRAAYYGEPLSDAIKQKLQKAAERDEPTNQAATLDGLAEQLRAKDEAFYQPQIDQLRNLADQFRRQNSAAD